MPRFLVLGSREAHKPIVAQVATLFQRHEIYTTPGHVLLPFSEEAHMRLALALALALTACGTEDDMDSWPGWTLTDELLMDGATVRCVATHSEGGVVWVVDLVVSSRLLCTATAGDYTESHSYEWRHPVVPGDLECSLDVLSDAWHDVLPGEECDGIPPVEPPRKPPGA